MTREPSKAQLNALQSAGVISDNCVTWADVADADRPAAWRFLMALDGLLL